MYELLGAFLVALQNSRRYKARDGGVYDHRETPFEYAARRRAAEERRARQGRSAERHLTERDLEEIERRFRVRESPQETRRKAVEERRARAEEIRKRNLEAAKRVLAERKPSCGCSGGSADDLRRERHRLENERARLRWERAHSGNRQPGH